jgi:hypothetical protein
LFNTSSFTLLCLDGLSFIPLPFLDFAVVAADVITDRNEALVVPFTMIIKVESRIDDAGCYVVE